MNERKLLIRDVLRDIVHRQPMDDDDRLLVRQSLCYVINRARDADLADICEHVLHLSDLDDMANALFGDDSPQDARTGPQSERGSGDSQNG